jgi:hypothetical protein
MSLLSKLKQLQPLQLLRKQRVPARRVGSGSRRRRVVAEAARGGGGARRVAVEADRGTSGVGRGGEDRAYAMVARRLRAGTWPEAATGQTLARRTGEAAASAPPSPPVLPSRSVPSSEVTKCDTNTSPRRLVTHLLQEVDQSFTSRRHRGHGSVNATRNNTNTNDHTTIAKASKASSEYHTMEALCGGPGYTGTVGCRAATYSTSSRTISGSSSEK